MSRFAYASFCDDVRPEINNKFSLMGLYAADMIFGDFPTTLPKMCVIMHIVTSVDKPFQEIVCAGRFQDNEVFKIHLKTSNLALGQPGVILECGHQRLRVQSMATIAPATFTSPGLFEIEIIADGEKIYCPGIAISKVPEGMTLVS
ncbi:DUF6941 family protein [Pseudomonas eucalypticola]|uniref:Uncharacterized protein n=1 Tax=Pseudomonas eucalypticola TaxID=2599595 RepID=A0A7D5D978_9PSED|nr:hypothetical protein [Pseudomonas eucalypticola]QKZ05856.1 hypothetical protein HWQ56_19495 [Pseudomonas eucalypticola]